MKKMRLLRDQWTHEDVEYFAHYGIKAKIGTMTIVLNEDERYNEIRQHFLKRWEEPLRAHDGYYYEYTKEEFEEAEYFVISGFYGCGYPQPEYGDYEAISYDKEKICQKCGCGRKQIDSLRVNKISKHNFWTFFSWIIDEFFVSKEIYEEVFAPYGIEKRDVIKDRKVLEDVYQLIIPVIDESLDLSDRDHWPCPECGEIKYDINLQHYPFFPRHANPLPGIYKTKEYFGAGRGGQAEHVIVICKDIVKKLLQTKDLKKFWLVPCR